MTHEWKIVSNEEEFEEFLQSIDLTKPIAVDTETKGQRPGNSSCYLLGVSISGYNKYSAGHIKSAYCLPCPSITIIFKYWLVGWNVPYDKTWLDYTFGIDTKWHADGRIMWHLQNNDPTVRGFGLKKAQKLLLGWEESNDKEFEEHIKSKGGKLSNGDHFLADVDVLGRYACLDTYSTLLCYERLRTFFDENNYWSFHKETLDYAIMLSQAANQGLPVSEVDLMRAAAIYEQKRESSKDQIRSVCSEEIKAIEQTWQTKQASAYKTDKGRENFLLDSLRQRRFNPSSAHQRALLLHTMLEFPVRETTPTGIPRTDRSNIALIKHESATTLVSYSEYKKIAEQSRTYLAAVKNERMFTNYDVCGTVSGRLSGFKPSVLNMPFSEPEVMSAFKCDDGFIGVHADLASIEPCVLAHYSEDPTLLKVYTAGLGDIYLDLALDLFPNDNELKKGYNPNAPITSEIKERFKDLRGVCKTIHLAVSYTGTYITVAKNLTKNGYPTTKGGAMQLVKSYWQKFSRVKAFEGKLQKVYERRGHIRNLTGRYIQVPDIYKKDLMNRLVQSSAHDILRLWVMGIIELFNSRGVEYRYWLPDLHDSTTFMVREGFEGRAKKVYEDALQQVEKELNLSVPLKMEFKTCKTLAGLKGKD
jgi:DNA polymerase I-like protein with 3'-5' exonuclease and polymerase domains